MAQLHVKDVNGLNFSELVRSNHQRCFSRACIIAFTNQLDDLIDDVERLHSTFEEVQTTFGFVETEFGTTSQYFDLVTDVSVECISQGELARHAINQSNHVDAETCLQLGLLKQVVEHHVGVGVTLQLDGEICFATR